MDNYRRERLIKRFWLVPKGVFLLGLIGPFFHSFLKIVAEGDYVMSGCSSTVDPHDYSIFISSFFCVWLILVFLVFFKKLYGAVFVKSVLVLGGSIVLMIFNIYAVLLLSCKELSGVGEFIALALPLSIAFTLLSLVFMRRRLIEAIDINKHAIDFDKGRWDISSALIHVSGKQNTASIAKWTMLASFLGVLLGRMSLYFMPGINLFNEYWIAVIAFWSIGTFIIAIYFVGDLYVTWVVWRRARTKGVKMLCKELADINPADKYFD
ncbi:MAG: hypothetical protein KC471_08205 [Flavobacteriaceae bacterium]|nr:hypothetical protein [Flavobacteriaceae bacterium]